MRMMDEIQAKFLKAIVGDKPCLDIWERVFQEGVPTTDGSSRRSLPEIFGRPKRR